MVHVTTHDTPHSFHVMLTRVPGIGKDLSKGGKICRVIHVQHEPVSDDGRAEKGWDAFVEAKLLPIRKRWVHDMKATSARRRQPR